MKLDQNLIGHPFQQEIIYQAILSHKFGHAYLYSGEEGIGKKTVALAVAKSLLCPQSLPFCGQCASCLKSDQKSHPDLFEIFPEGQFIKIGQIKQIQEKMVLQPLLGIKKVFIIDDAEKMNQEAANAFLKSLEEPPIDTHFILVTSRPQAILSTIFSRCQQIRFFPPPIEELANLLAKNKNLPVSDARQIAKRSHGKIGLALSLDITAIDLEDESYFQLMQPEILESPTRLFQLSEEFSRDADHLKKTVAWILSCIRDMILWKRIPDPEYLILDRQWEKIRDSASRFSDGQLHDSFVFFQKVERLIQRNINRALALETGILQLTRNRQP